MENSPSQHTQHNTSNGFSFCIIVFYMIRIIYCTYMFICMNVSVARWCRGMMSLWLWRCWSSYSCYSVVEKELYFFYFTFASIDHKHRRNFTFFTYNNGIEISSKYYQTEFCDYISVFLLSYFQYASLSCIRGNYPRNECVELVTGARLLGMDYGKL